MARYTPMHNYANGQPEGRKLHRHSLVIILAALVLLLLVTGCFQPKAISTFAETRAKTHAAGLASKDQSKNAYAQYVTNSVYLCNAIVLFTRLLRYGTTAQLALMYPREWDILSDKTDESQQISLLMGKARDMGVHFYPFDDISTPEALYFYLHVNNKFNVMNLTRYDRVIYFDSDALLYKSLDNYFDLPSSPLALTRAYWYPQPNYMTSAFMVIEPSEFLFNAALSRLPGGAAFKEGVVEDMDIIQHMADGYAMLIPHRHLFLLSMEFRDGLGDSTHSRYLRSAQSGQEWDPVEEYKHAGIIHWSEGGPKPWEGRYRMDPLCAGRTDAGCTVWRSILDEYYAETEQICQVVYADRTAEQLRT